MENKQFEKWLINKCINPEKSNLGVTDDELLARVMEDFFFDELPLSMQKGVYEEFFKSKGIQISADLLDIDKAFEILELSEAGKKGAKAGEEMRDKLLGK